MTRTDGPEPRVEVGVADDGPGIPDHERAVLEDGRETPLEHGSGLGLWIVVWKSGGAVEFEPNDPEGTVVTSRFDAAPRGTVVGRSLPASPPDQPSDDE